MKALLLLGMIVLAPATAREPQRWAIVDYGTYQVTADGRQSAPGSSSGDIGVVSALESLAPVAESTTVEAALGVVFGFNYVDHSRAAFDLTPVQIRVEHPPIVSIDGRTIHVDSWTASAQGIPRFTGWKFERVEEMVPGRWTISVLHDGTVVLSKSFDVRRPSASATPGSRP